MRTGRYRVRRGLFGKSVLQAQFDTPSLVAGRVDTSVRDVFWCDVPWSKAPAELEAVNRRKASEVLEVIDARIDAIYHHLYKEISTPIAER